MLLLTFIMSLFISDTLSQYDVREPYVYHSSIGNVLIETKVKSHLVEPDSCCKKPILIFYSDGKEIQRIEFNVDEHWASDVKFKVVKLSEFSDSVIVAVACSPGGSDCQYESTVIGVVDGTIQDLFQEHLVSHNQGALCIEKLSRSDSTQIILWKELWEDGTHYDPHRYCATIFRWNGHFFTQMKAFETKKKYPVWQDAGKKFGFQSSFDYVDHLFPNFR